jgi:hypothetical protein
MRFLSIYKAAETGIPPTQEHMDEMGRLIEEMQGAGVLLATEGCLPSALGARVRLSGGEVTVTDGPFTESKEWINGWGINEFADLDHAIEVMAKHPVARFGQIEIRPFYDWEAEA